MDVAVGDIDGGLHGAAALDDGELVCGEDLVNHGPGLPALGAGGKAGWVTGNGRCGSLFSRGRGMRAWVYILT